MNSHVGCPGVVLDKERGSTETTVSSWKRSWLAEPVGPQPRVGEKGVCLDSSLALAFLDYKVVTAGERRTALRIRVH